MALQLRKSPESANYYNLMVIPEKRTIVKKKTHKLPAFRPLLCQLTFFHLKVKFYNLTG